MQIVIKTLTNQITKLLKVSFISMIYLYRYSLSYFLGNRCRYSPSCSEFALSAFKNLDLLLAFELSLKRIARCHNIKFLPLMFGKNFKPGHGYDPVSNHLKKH